MTIGIVKDGGLIWYGALLLGLIIILLMLVEPDSFFTNT